MRANRFRNTVRHINKLLPAVLICQILQECQRDFRSSRKLRLEGYKSAEHLAEIQRPFTALFSGRRHILYLQFLLNRQLRFRLIGQGNIRFQNNGLPIRILFFFPKKTVEYLKPADPVFFDIRAVIAPCLIRSDDHDRFRLFFLFFFRFFCRRLFCRFCSSHHSDHFFCGLLCNFFRSCLFFRDFLYNFFRCCFFLQDCLLRNFFQGCLFFRSCLFFRDFL